MKELVDWFHASDSKEMHHSLSEFECLGGAAKILSLILDRCCGARAGLPVQGNMRIQLALVILLSGLLCAQDRRTVPFEQLDEVRAMKCIEPLPDGFRCGILFDLDFQDSSNMIRSVVGGTIDHLFVILDSTLYRVSYDPPMRRDDKFFKIERKSRIPARVEGNQFIIRWPDGSEAKGKIIRRERINPDRPQPA